MRISPSFCLLICLCGCTSLGGDPHARELEHNRLDDSYCVEHGLHYPDAAYVQCRRQLVDRRLNRDWQNLRAMQRAGQPAVAPMQASPPSLPFRTPDPAGFHCHAAPQFGNDYVFCGYDDGAAPR